MSVTIPRRQLFIDGEWREPLHQKRIPIINPATEDTIGTSSPFGSNYQFGQQFIVMERKSELAMLEALDCGKPLEEAAGDVGAVAECFRYYAHLGEALDEKQTMLSTHTFKSHVIKEPIGVVGLITPWNYPLLMAAWKVAPALAAGCTAVLKPSELASVTCMEFAELCKEAGLPSGVLNIVTGFGTEAGAPLASHPHVDKVAFTGSTETGRMVMTAAAAGVKEIQAGITWVNCSQPCFLQAPWGGRKNSCFGRDLGEWGLDNFLNMKQVTEYVSDDQWGWYHSPKL